MRAYEILQRYQHTQVDTEHLFLALVEQANGMVPQILDRLAVPPSVVAAKLDEVLQTAPRLTNAPYGGGVSQVFITPRLKRVTDTANE